MAEERMRKITLSVSGMHCADCALSLEQMLSHLKGVRQVNVNYLYETAVITYDPDLTGLNEISRAIGRPGYGIREIKPEEGSFLSSHWESLLLIFVAVMLLAGWLLALFDFVVAGRILTLTGALAALYPIARNAIYTILGRSLNVDVLVSIAVLAALYIGAWLEAGLVAFIMLLGEVLEDFTTDRTRSAIRKLMDLGPQEAKLKRDGVEITVSTAEVRTGDVLVVRPGEKVPVDGVIAYGSVAVNEAAITGESVPADKGPGDRVFAGTLLESGAMEVEASRVGQDTTLAHIRRLVEEAQEKKAPVERQVDRFAVWFIPAVLLTALLVYLITGESTRAITVLVVACPCALVLATPTAVVAGIGKAAGRGILVKGGVYMERVGRVSAVALDKTGTLTSGRISVADVWPVPGLERQDVMLPALEAEALSEHPLGRAVTEEARRAGVEASGRPVEFRSRRGRGVEAEVDGHRVLVGNRRLLEENGLRVAEEVEERLRFYEEAGQTPALVARGGSVLGIIAFADTLRPSALEAIGLLKSAGVRRIVMLTGDNARTAAAMAERLDIDFKAGLLPEEKAEIISQMRQEGVTAMVGDGINDAPALARADTGIAMGAAGSDIALETADIALMSDDLAKVAEVIRLSRRVLARIRQNLVFALAFNIAAVILAAFGTIALIAGALLHQVSSLVVILNSAVLLAGRETK